MNPFLMDNLIAFGSWILLFFVGIQVSHPGTAEGLAKGIGHLFMLPYMFLIANTIACYQMEFNVAFHVTITLTIVASILYIPGVIYPIYIADRIRRIL